MCDIINLLQAVLKTFKKFLCLIMFGRKSCADLSRYAVCRWGDPYAHAARKLTTRKSRQLAVQWGAGHPPLHCRSASRLIDPGKYCDVPRIDITPHVSAWFDNDSFVITLDGCLAVKLLACILPDINVAYRYSEFRPLYYRMTFATGLSYLGETLCVELD